MPFTGDYFNINEANFGGAKSNMFVSETVTQDYVLQSDGSIVKTVTVNYKNPYPPSDCNLERGNLCLNAVLRDWFSLLGCSISVDARTNSIFLLTEQLALWGQVRVVLSL